jgi:superfamily II RNA helicase
MKRTYFKKTRRGHFGGRRKPASRKREIPKIKPDADFKLKKVFARIGAPPRKAFKPDPFQLQAVAAIRESDCLVSAPTGSGKTWIAEEAIRRIHIKGGMAWYASPLKALTNSKLLEFGEIFGREQVGILTGDRKENAEAPIIVGTTEILRNQLYDAMNEGTDLKTDLVILDEAHFLGDEDRGVVWEEIMIYLPHRVPLLLLSATIGNARQIADWLESIRSKSCVVVEEKGRPVPLFPLFFHPAGKLLPLLDSKGIYKKVKSYLKSPRPPVLAPPRRLPPFGDILRVLRKFNLLPAIFFMKSRADCDAALERCVDKAGTKIGAEAALERRIDQLTAGQSRLRGHRQMWHLGTAAVAAHHSGQLPAWKLVIERLMTEGLLNAVFATSTVAAGVNFPARSVVFLNSDRYNGHGFVPLDGTEFHQTTGRAGRRGKDRIGFAVVIPGQFMDVRLIADLYSTPPEEVHSQIKVNFSMVLNLLLSHSPDEIREVFQRSFATYLSLVNRQPGLNQRLKETGRRIMVFLPDARCSGPELVLDLIRQRRAIIRELGELQRELRTLESRLSKFANLVPGRLFRDHRGRVYCVITPKVKREERGVLACRVKRDLCLKGNRLRTRWFRPQKVSQILDKVLSLPSGDNPDKIRRLLLLTAQDGTPPEKESLPFGEEELLELRPLRNRALFLEQQLDGLVCSHCGHSKMCHGKGRGPFKRALEDFALPWDSVNAARMRLWNDFVKHIEFMKEEGFVSRKNKLTDDGMWASKLRLDQPLLIAEGLRKKVLPESDPILLAALVATFVYDRDVEDTLDQSHVPASFLSAFEKMTRALTPLMERKAVCGFEVRPMARWPGATLYAWANGEPWEKALEVSGMSEGDLSMLVLRTAENLRQISSLAREYPAIARSAMEAIDMILRDPVVVAY